MTCCVVAFDLPSVAEGRGGVSPSAELLERLLLVLASQARRGAEGRTSDSQRSDGGSRPDGGGTEEGGRGAPGGDTEERHFFLSCFFITRWIGSSRFRKQTGEQKKEKDLKIERWENCLVVTQGEKVRASQIGRSGLGSGEWAWAW